MGFAGNTFAQDVTARIDGQVTDPNGAVVLSAAITLTNTKTGEVRTAVSNDSGGYTLTQIQPGTYDLSVKAQGFKEYLSRGLEISVNDRKTINIGLETGAITESITVTAEAPLLQTSPTVGDVVENRRVVELPLNNRNFMQLLTLVPGVTGSGTSEIGIGLTNTVDFSVNGTRRNSINFLVDGAS
ncbi:MAG TPA: carboxypeptidase-like regulatory domain-containing protein, partial [Pyrinomonadaceae bacterium]